MRPTILNVLCHCCLFLAPFITQNEFGMVLCEYGTDSLKQQAGNLSIEDCRCYYASIFFASDVTDIVVTVEKASCSYTWRAQPTSMLRIVKVLMLE